MGRAPECLWLRRGTERCGELQLVACTESLKPPAKKRRFEVALTAADPRTDFKDCSRLKRGSSTWEGFTCRRYTAGAWPGIWI